MALNWNEIKERAVSFSKEWENTTNEEADAKPFLDAFFDVFGISRKKIGTFEHRVKKLNAADGYIDLLWKGVILVEMKSRGKNLDKAFEQAITYTHGLKDYELPKYILVCDFHVFRIYDTEEEKIIEFTLKEFVSNVQHFGFIAGYIKRTYKEQDPVNIRAAELMGKLHDRLKEIGYEGHPLEVYLVRLLFCLFAEDTNIFEKQQFQDYITQRTNEDGSDLAAKLQEVFQVLNTANEKRFKNLDEQLAFFPYVNGKLFEEILPTASFDAKMRNVLLECCYIDWSKISPAIFGSMFQSVMNQKERRNLGAHYTSEKNILKLIKPLFLDELYVEFEKVKNSTTNLTHFHNKIAQLRFLDPACGCGNFLIITYREIRLLELAIILRLQELNNKIHQMDFLDISLFFKVNVDKFYGIEYEEFPARIAEVAMWLIDHQMNMHANIETGGKLFRIPLVKSAKIVHGNALLIDWNSLLNEENTIQIHVKDAEIKVNTMVKEPAPSYGKIKLVVDSYKIVDQFSETKPDSKFDYIIGNPPFVGKKEQTVEQKQDMLRVFTSLKGTGILDYVAAWYFKAAQLIQDSNTKVAFVSTNSISQGEQVGILWNLLYNTYHIKIHFAHQTFSWKNEAKGNAAVHCVVVGFASFDVLNKSIFEYDDIKGEPHEIKVKNINPYLVDSKDIFIGKRRNSICNAPEISFGNMPNDGGNFFISEDEFENLKLVEPISVKHIKPFLGAHEFLNGQKKWCFWFDKINPKDLNDIPFVYKRIKEVEKLRKKSTRETTRNLALFPTLFGEIRQPKSNFILIPRHSSENRKYIPFGYYSPDNIVGDTCLAVENTTMYHFGILQSFMHLAWIKTLCGRIKSDFRYSNEIVYNNYPWPENPTEKQIETIKKASEKIIEIRNSFEGNSLADLYDPIKMPPALVKAHNELDKAVDLAYRPQAFVSDAKRMEFLFELYEKYTANLFTKQKVKRVKKAQN